MEQYYLAVDIGASSGRHILGWQEDGVLKLEEIYRFENGYAELDGKKLWDTGRLLAEILNGMKQCSRIGKIPVSMAIDTWAVDYVLLDSQDQVVGDTYSYRDSRTEGMDEEVSRWILPEALYERTGIQKQMFNTIYQLMAQKLQEPEVLSQARTLLMLPDYFQFLLTGNKQSEYTNATSTQLVSPATGQWDKGLIRLLGYPKDIFLPLVQPGTPAGRLRPEIQAEVGFDTEVISCASHDTASAVMAMPREGSVYISSGTWSLMGVESKEALCGEASRKANFTNEGGYEHRFRYLKNIMGLWMIQSVRRELNQKAEQDYSFAQLCSLAEEARTFPSRVEVNDPAFLAPDSMTEAIQGFCRRIGQPVPESPGELAAVIYQSLAACYGETVREIEAATGRTYPEICVIGGGSNAGYLNQLTANATGKTVWAGPGEATAIGNLLAQMLKTGVFQSLKEARDCVAESFAVKEYKPEA